MLTRIRDSPMMEFTTAYSNSAENAGRIAQHRPAKDVAGRYSSLQDSWTHATGKLKRARYTSKGDW